MLARTGWLEAYQALLAAEVTLPAMQRFATDIVSALSTPDLHELAQQLNYDCGGEWLAGLIVQQPVCDIETARHLYWALDPAYGHWSHAPADAYYSCNVVAIWQAIEHRCAGHATLPFRRDLPRSNMRAEWVPEAIPNFALSP